MHRDLNESFAVEEGYLVRKVVPAVGTPYEHRCPLATFEEVAHQVDERAAAGASFSLDELVGAAGKPNTQVNTALAFLRERGIVHTGPRRRNVGRPGARPGTVHLDAMVEYWALYEEPRARARENAANAGPEGGAA